MQRSPMELDPSKKPEGQPAEADASSEERLHLDQDEIDALLAGPAGGASPERPSRFQNPPPQIQPVSSSATRASGESSADTIDQDTLDLLFQPKADDSESGVLDQAAIDALLAGAASGGGVNPASPSPAATPSPADGKAWDGPPMRQEDIDAILLDTSALEDPPPEDPDDPALVAAAERMMGDTGHEPVLAPVIEQAELDQLLEEAKRERAEAVAAQMREREAASKAANTPVVAAAADEALVAPVVEKAQVALAAEVADIPSSAIEEDLAADRPLPTEPAVSMAPDPFAEDAAAPVDEDVVSDEVLAALMAAAGDEPAGSPAHEPLLETGEVPHAMSTATAPRVEEAAAEEPEMPSGDAAGVNAAVRMWPRIPAQFPNREFARLTTSVAAGLLAAISTFTGLYVYQERVPQFSELSALSPVNELDTAMANARTLLRQGDGAGAFAVLEGPISRAPQSPSLLDAQILALESRFEAMGPNPLPSEGEAFVADADRLHALAPTHPQAPQVLYWQAKVYEGMNMRPAAKDTLTRAVDLYGESPYLDQILFEAARLELSMRETSEASDHARRLLQQFPGSAYGNEARLLLADAYNQANLIDEAQAIYARLAETETGSALGAEAYLRLAELAMEQGDAKSAASLLEDRLATAMTTEGNDRVYVMLGQAQLEAGDFESAVATLNDVVTFFPDSPVLPRAYIQLSQAYERQGQRAEALRVARQAAARFPDSAPVLSNAGELLGLNGDALGAAEALMAADVAGANDAGQLLTAARHFKTAGAPGDARKAYDLLQLHYPRSAEAITGSIEEARVMYDQGQVSAAIERLENLLLTLKGEPQQLLALRTLSGMYEALGLRNRVQELALEAAGLSTEPEVLAETAHTLLRTGNVEEGQAVVGRLPLESVNDLTAYKLLIEQGKALLAGDPQRGVGLLEQAYLRYPQARTAEGDQVLLEAYIGTNRRAAARRMVSEIQAEAMSDPVEIPRLLRAAVSWGDALYQAGDHRGAAEAYGMASTATDDTSTLSPDQMRDILWARYQRANMLLQSSDYQEAFRMYQEIASSDAPWAKEAATKANYTRTQLRLRGLPIPEPDAQG